jgi:2-dehydropantoate 2-reductase
MTRSPSFAVLGAGAVGGYFGGRLAAAGFDVTFLARGQTLADLRARGLRITSIAGDAHVQPVKACSELAELGVPDVVLVAVKTWQLDPLLRELPSIVGPQTVVVPLLNGVEAPERLAAVLDRRHVVGGLCEIGAVIEQPGHVRHFAAVPVIRFGELDGAESPRLDALAEAFGRAGVEAVHTREVVLAMWRKFLLIVGYGGIGALARVSIGPLLQSPETRALLVTAMREVVEVANARGVGLSAADMESTFAYLERLPEGATTSLQRDIMAGRPSELDAWTGAVVRLAEVAGVAVPLNAVILALLSAQERQSRGG